MKKFILSAALLIAAVGIVKGQTQKVDGSLSLNVNSNNSLSQKITGIGFNRDFSNGTIFDNTIPAWQFTVRSDRFSLEGYNGIENKLFTVLSNGNLGIGTITPTSKLEVNGDIKGTKINTEVAAHNYINLGANGITLSGLGFNRDAQTGTILNMAIPAWQFTSRSDRFSLEGYNGAYSSPLTVLKSGNVGIGTAAPDKLLTVNGTIHAKEVQIDLTGALADYVFKPEYKLMPLHEVEQFVKTNSHLPEMPSAAHVEENGMNLGEMQNKLLQKIEELTLYMIEQNKEIQSLKAENKAIKQQLKNK